MERGIPKKGLERGVVSSSDRQRMQEDHTHRINGSNIRVLFNDYFTLPTLPTLPTLRYKDSIFFLVFRLIFMCNKYKISEILSNTKKYVKNE